MKNCEDLHGHFKQLQAKQDPTLKVHCFSATASGDCKIVKLLEQAV